MRSLVGTVSNTRMDEFGSEGPAKKAEGGGGGGGSWSKISDMHHMNTHYIGHTYQSTNVNTRYTGFLSSVC